MGLYETQAEVEAYIAKAEGHNGRAHIDALIEIVPGRSKVLELGMGPGVDLDMLDEIYEVVGTDASRRFLRRYRRSHPDVALVHTDAVSIEVDQTFDAIYSNKVLHHLTTEELGLSLGRQAQVVRPGGILLHGIWVGDYSEEIEGVHCQYYTCETFAAVVPPELELISCEPYGELDEDDSLRIMLRRRRAA